MLLTQKALIEGARVLILFAGMQMDRALHHPDASTRTEAEELLSLLTPVVKGFVTGMSLECTSDALQVHGGHGYVRETGVEQFFRDARITMIYEGANGVQAMDLLGRKVLGSGGALARRLGGLIGGFCERHGEGGEHAEFVARLAGLLKEWSVATEEVALRAARNPDETGAASMDYLQLTGYLCLAWCWAWMASVSVAALKSGAPEAGFHRAKIATARFYFQRILPRAEAHLDAMGAGARYADGDPGRPVLGLRPLNPPVRRGRRAATRRSDGRGRAGTPPRPCCARRARTRAGKAAPHPRGARRPAGARAARPRGP